MTWYIIGMDRISQAAQIIKDGGLVAFPTETVYGLGANALDATAVAKIFEVKERPSFDPLIVHIADIDMLSELADMGAISAPVKEYIKVIDGRAVGANNHSPVLPGPLTIVLPKKEIGRASCRERV